MTETILHKTEDHGLHYHSRTEVTCSHGVNIARILVTGPGMFPESGQALHFQGSLTRSPEDLAGDQGLTATYVLQALDAAYEAGRREVPA